MFNIHKAKGDFRWGGGGWRMLRWSSVCTRGGVITTGSGGGAWIFISDFFVDHLAPPGSCRPELSRAAPPVLPQCPMGFTERSPPLLETHCHLILSNNQLKWSHTHTHTDTHTLTDEKIRCMEVSEQNGKKKWEKTSRKLIKHEIFF